MSHRRKKELQAGGEHEEYITPTWAVDRLLEDPIVEALVREDGYTRWLEPACGDCNIVRAVNAKFDGIEWGLVDIRQECSQSMLAVPGAKVRVADFFSLKPKTFVSPIRPEPKYPFDIAILNPPYSLALGYIQHVRQFAPIAIVLLPWNFLSSADRAEFMSTTLPEWMRGLPDRPKFSLGSADSRDYAWMAWTEQSGPECTSIRMLATTPKDVRKAQEGPNVRAAHRALMQTRVAQAGASEGHPGAPEAEG